MHLTDLYVKPHLTTVVCL